MFAITPNLKAFRIGILFANCISEVCRSPALFRAILSWILWLHPDFTNEEHERQNQLHANSELAADHSNLNKK